ncbi:Hypothetical protein PBC10988_10040 [Planctomycetales bacterium 10988]|nr:Hypothetical protein PBC10988_10040 [Planctomycetales bacterium 10988]
MTLFDRLYPYLVALSAMVMVGSLALYAVSPEEVPLTPSGEVLADTEVAKSPTIQATPIEQIRVGQRVPGRNPEVSDLERSRFIDPDPQTRRKLEMRLIKEDGHTLDITLLRSLAWIEQTKAKVGGTVYLEMHELGAVGDAKVLSLEDCPRIAPPPGNVVTGKFAHSTDQPLVDVLVEGLTKPIGCTSNHLFWSETRQDFIEAGQLQPGETVRTLKAGKTKIVSFLPRPPTDKVYNLEVHGEHVYQVAKLGVLVHNTYPSNIPRASITLTFQNGWNRRDFSRKARALQDLAERGKLRKATNPIARDPNLTGQYKNRLIRRAHAMFAQSDPAKFSRLRDRIRSRDIHSDHLQDLQLSGLDEASNLWLLDAEVNRSLGGQIWQQIRNLEDGTIIDRIDIVGF